MAITATLANGVGIPVTSVASNGTPMTLTDGLGLPVVIVESGGFPVIFVDEDNQLVSLSGPFSSGFSNGFEE